MDLQTTLTGSEAGMVAAAIAFLSAYSFVIIACAVLAIIGLWKVNIKAGEPGWAAIVPFYNSYILYKIAWGNGLLFLLLLIPFVNAVVSIITSWKLGKAFGAGTGFCLGLIFLSPIFLMILGFGQKQFQGTNDN